MFSLGLQLQTKNPRLGACREKEFPETTENSRGYCHRGNQEVVVPSTLIFLTHGSLHALLTI